MNEDQDDGDAVLRKLMHDAYERGWLQANKWATRVLGKDDALHLDADTESPAYAKDRDEALKALQADLPTVVPDGGAAVVFYPDGGALMVVPRKNDDEGDDSMMPLTGVNAIRCASLMHEENADLVEEIDRRIDAALKR